MTTSLFEQSRVLDSVARIMAAESISIIEKSGIQTAYFDLVNRIVYIPIWDDKELTYENHVALRSHEVGHALWTPADTKLFDELEKEGIIGYVNVIEDIRINEFLKRKYPGLIRIFNQSYKHFFDTFFYRVTHESVNDLNFADRINIAFKVGTYAGVRFSTPEETNFVAKLNNIYAFSQVIELARELAAIEKKKYEDHKEDILKLNILSSEKAFENALKGLTRIDVRATSILITDQKYNLERYVRRYTEFVMDVCDFYTEKSTKTYQSYKNENQSLISYMVKEFEMRKSAREYQNRKFSESGVLDPLKVYKHSYDEEIFLRKTLVEKGKNHGLVMFVDWSGSMGEILQNTLFQLLNIVLFCKRLSIPFTVYIFRDSNKTVYNNKQAMLGKRLDPNSVELVEILSHEMSAKYFNIVMGILSTVDDLLIHCRKYSLTSTPLNECIMLSRDLVSEFIKKNRLEKTTIIYLTDGIASSNIFYLEGSIVLSQYSRCQKIIKSSNSGGGLTAALLDILRFETNLKVCGIYIPNSSVDVDIKVSSCTQDSQMQDDLKQKYINHGFVTLEGLGYDKLYVIDKSLINMVNDGTSLKFKTRESFTDNRKSRMQSMSFLRSFIEMIS